MGDNAQGHNEPLISNSRARIIVSKVKSIANNKTVRLTWNINMDGPRRIG
jgi:hypothetical protein